LLKIQHIPVSELKQCLLRIMAVDAADESPLICAASNPEINIMNDQSSSTHPLKAIASKFETREHMQSGQDSEERPHDQKEGEQFTGATACPELSPERITAPALLMDNELRIAWQNNAARTQLWRLPEATEDKALLYIFDLLLDPAFRNSVTNWREWVAFFIRQSRPLLAPQELEQLLENRDETEREILKPFMDDAQAAAESGAPPNVLRLVVPDASAGHHTSFCVVGTTFDKGRLLVFEERPDEFTESSMSKTAELQQRLAMLPRHPASVKKIFHALAARLNDVGTLRAEMLDEEFSRLLHRLWADSVTTIEQDGGIVAQHAGDGLIGFFLPADDVYSPLSVIQCALKLKMRMTELGREWKIRKGWLHDIQLNIGLDTGNEYLATLQTALGENLIPAGDTAQMAAYLAHQAVNGQIWATKTLVNQVPSIDLKNINFGIFRSGDHRQIFIARSFSRLREITDETAFPPNVRVDFGNRSVTQIFDQMAQEEIKIDYSLP
jgi:adenylate cyclase